MSSVNLVILVGHLGADPELRYSPDGKPVANLRLATSKVYKDRDGERQEKTEWHRVVAFNKTAEVLGEYAKKGSLLFVEGEISTRSWTDKEEQKRYSTEVICNRFQFLGGGGQRERDPAEAPAGSVREQGRQPAAAAPARGTGFDDMDDDIPF
jgi:single-strand DNA-binding protein